MTRLIALTGATGYVGRFVANHLLKQGYRLRALSRPTSDRGGFDGEIEWLDGHLSSESVMPLLVDGAAAVIHIAYEHVAERYRGGEGDDLPAWLDSNLMGSLNLLMAAKDARVPRFIFLSTRAVFSYTEVGRVLDESHPTSPDSHYGAYKAAVEAFMSSVGYSTRMKTTTIRATGVYGITRPVERSKWWELISAVLNNQPVTQVRAGTEIHGEDVARAISALLTHELPPAALHLSDLTVTTREVVRLARYFSGIAGDLPAEPASFPQNVLVSRHLNDLGLTLGGVPLLEKTIAEMVNLAQSG